jgi:hypothetical protein
MKPNEPLAKRHPYLWAHDAYVAGRIHSSQAALMCASDREFKAECELQGLTPRTEALRIVRDIWSADLVASALTARRSSIGLSIGLYAAPNPAGRHTYCGPTAIAALTGRAVEDVEAHVMAYRAEHGTPKRCRVPKGLYVKAMELRECAALLRLLGRPCETVFCSDRPTFARWRRTRAQKGARYLVLVTGHFVAMAEGYMVDTAQRTPVEASRIVRLQRKRVVAFIRMED